MSSQIVGSAMCMSLVGLEAHRVRVEAVVLSGLPTVTIVGLADTAVCEARERLRASFSHIGIPWPNQRLTLNLSPADTGKSGTGFDLAIAAAIFNALGYRSLPEDTLVIGELGLDGRVHAVRGVLPCVLAAAEQGFREVYVPHGNEAEARLVPGIRVVPVEHLAQLAHLVGISTAIMPAVSSAPDTEIHSEAAQMSDLGDFSDVYGQNEAIWALQIAAVGGHHVQLVGPPGVGKSMLAQRFPGILPRLSQSEAVEVAAIQSLTGKRIASSPTVRPLAAPHHTASTSALVGGGSGVPSPGAVTFAHNGVLFCDEFPEFSTRSIQALHQPMETGWVDLHRARSHVRYPARFQLIAAANPCRCGHAMDAQGMCVCKPYERATYRSNLGGPVRDRFDIRLVLQRPTKSRIAQRSAVSTAQAYSAVEEAYARSTQRWNSVYCQYVHESVPHSGNSMRGNTRLPGRWLREHTPYEPAVESMIERRLSRGQMSLRGLDRVLRVAWSIADINAHSAPTSDDIASAFTLRGGDDLYGE